MLKKRVITGALVFALAASVPALAIFGIPSPEDLLIWFVPAADHARQPTRHDRQPG